MEVARSKNLNDMLVMFPLDYNDFVTGDLSTTQDDTQALKFAQETPPDASKTFEELGDLFPCLLLLCGSNGGMFLVRVLLPVLMQ